MSISAMTAKKPTNGVASTKHFELPVLDLTFGSLTEGTNIPPPLPSPKDELPPEPKFVAKEQEEEEEDKKKKRQSLLLPVTYPEPPKTAEPIVQKQLEPLVPVVPLVPVATVTPPSRSETTISNNVTLKRAAEEAPPSPAPSSRSSFRRFFGKSQRSHDERSSVTTQATTIHATAQTPSRASSRAPSTTAEEKKAKRSSWFWRLRFHDSPIADKPVAEEVETPSRVPTGPPPPKIPELTALKTKIDTRLGDDLFKGIGRDH